MNLILAAMILGGACNVRANVVAAPVVTTTAAYVQLPVLDPYFHYTVGAAQRLRKLEEIAERQMAIVEQQRQLIEQYRIGAVAPGQPADSPIESQARQILQASCVKCHSGDSPKGGIRLDGELDVATKLLVDGVVTSGAMPPKPAEQLDDNTASVISTWATEDQAAVRAFLRAQVKQAKQTPAIKPGMPMPPTSQ